MREREKTIPSEDSLEVAKRVKERCARSSHQLSRPPIPPADYPAPAQRSSSRGRATLPFIVIPSPCRADLSSPAVRGAR